MLILTSAFLAVVIVGVFAIGVWIGYHRRHTIDEQLEKIENFHSPIHPVGGAEFFEPTTTEADALEKVIADNKAKGRDTKLDEIS